MTSKLVLILAIALLLGSCLGMLAADLSDLPPDQAACRTASVSVEPVVSSEPAPPSRRAAAPAAASLPPRALPPSFRC